MLTSIQLTFPPYSHVDLQITRNRHQPPRDALNVRDRIPEVRLVGVVGLTDGQDVRLPGIDRARPKVALHRVDLMIDINLSHVVSLRRCRLPRAISVASASRRGDQKRRKPSSHSSTSRKAEPFTA
jgi:hypothetical protein